MQISKKCGTILKRYSICVLRMLEEKKKEEAEEPFILIMTKNFPKLMTEKKKTTNMGSLHIGI